MTRANEHRDYASAAHHAVAHEHADKRARCAWVRRCFLFYVHPDLEPLETWAAAHGVQIVKEPGNLRSDFAKLAHAPHLATDYSSLGSSRRS